VSKNGIRERGNGYKEDHSGGGGKERSSSSVWFGAGTDRTSSVVMAEDEEEEDVGLKGSNLELASKTVERRDRSCQFLDVVTLDDSPCRRKETRREKEEWTSVRSKVSDRFVFEREGEEEVTNFFECIIRHLHLFVGHLKHLYIDRVVCDQLVDLRGGEEEKGKKEMRRGLGNDPYEKKRDNKR